MLLLLPNLQTRQMRIPQMQIMPSLEIVFNCAVVDLAAAVGVGLDLEGEGLLVGGSSGDVTDAVFPFHGAAVVDFDF